MQRVIPFRIGRVRTKGNEINRWPDLLRNEQEYLCEPYGARPFCIVANTLDIPGIRQAFHEIALA